MFDIGLGEFALLGVLALLVFGPDRLPSVAASAGKWVNQARIQLTKARSQISESAELNSLGQDLRGVADLHPRRVMQSLAEPLTEGPKPTEPTRPASVIDPNAT